MIFFGFFLGRCLLETIGLAVPSKVRSLFTYGYFCQKCGKQVLLETVNSSENNDCSHFQSLILMSNLAGYKCVKCGVVGTIKEKKQLKNDELSQLLKHAIKLYIENDDKPGV